MKKQLIRGVSYAIIFSFLLSQVIYFSSCSSNRRKVYSSGKIGNPKDRNRQVWGNKNRNRFIQR